MPKVALSTVMLVFVLQGLPGGAVAQEPDLSGLSGEEMLEEADDLLDRIDATVQEVQTLAERTRQQEADLAKLRCIHEKLAALQGFQRLSQEARSSLSNLVSRNDVEGMRHQYTLILIASQRVENLEREANQCVGEILTYAGDSQRAADIDESIPDETDWTASGAATLDLERITPSTPLPEATPYQ